VSFLGVNGSNQVPAAPRYDACSVKSLSELALQYFARGIAGQVFNEKDTLWHLVGGERLAGIGYELGFLDPRAVAERHDRGNRFDPFRMGHADDGDFEDRRMSEERVLDLAAGD